MKRNAGAAAADRPALSPPPLPQRSRTAGAVVPAPARRRPAGRGRRNPNPASRTSSQLIDRPIGKHLTTPPPTASITS